MEEKVFIVEYYFHSYLGFERPDVIIQKPLHSTRVTIWCAISAHGILGPYFNEDQEGNALTVTQERYRDMVIEPFLQNLRRFCHARGLHMNRVVSTDLFISVLYILAHTVLPEDRAILSLENHEGIKEAWM
jgi:hypothetical protein